MIFRKDSLLFYQSEAFCIIVLILCPPLIPILGLVFVLLCMVSFVGLALINPHLYNEYITINESGISCQKAGTLLWAYEWNSITELKNSSRFLLPSIEIIVNNKNVESPQYSTTNYYFQLNRTAKEAIKRYYHPAGHSSNK